MSWYRLVISHEDAVRGKFELVHEMIATRHKAAGAPVGIFMYGMSIYDMKQTLDTDSTYYFPPDASTIVAGNVLRALGAVPCSKPGEVLSPVFECGT